MAFHVEDVPTVYRGSVKNLRELEPPRGQIPGIYLFEFTDDYSIFDYGKMPDTIPGKGKAMALMCAYIFEKLGDARSWRELASSSVWEAGGRPMVADSSLASSLYDDLSRSGLRTHYSGLVDEEGRRKRTDELDRPTPIMEVRAARILRPQQVFLDGHSAWSYHMFHPGLDNYLIPVENVFRFGAPKGSSLLERISGDPGYAKRLGFESIPSEGEKFDRPILEYFSKLEPTDRFLAPETAMNFSGRTCEEFVTLGLLTRFTAVFLLDMFGRVGIDLWDGKFEFLMMGGPVLADAVTPDELRLTRRDVQISKEPVRQYYRRRAGDFLERIREAKQMASMQEKGLAAVLRDELDYTPPTMDPGFRSVIADMYASLTVSLTGIDIIEGARPLDDVITDIDRFL